MEDFQRVEHSIVTLSLSGREFQFVARPTASLYAGLLCVPGEKCKIGAILEQFTETHSGPLYVPPYGPWLEGLQNACSLTNWHRPSQQASNRVVSNKTEDCRAIPKDSSY
jgi:hypothetical protein